MIVGVFNTPPLAILAYAFANCNGVTVIPWPKETLLNKCWLQSPPWIIPLDSPGKSTPVFFPKPNTERIFFTLSCPKTKDIFVAPIFELKAKISLTVSHPNSWCWSASPICLRPIFIFPFSQKNFVFGCQFLNCKPAATINVFIVEPGSNDSNIGLFLQGFDIECSIVEIGWPTPDIPLISLVCASNKTATPPSAFCSLTVCDNSLCNTYCNSRSNVNIKSSPSSLSVISNPFTWRGRPRASRLTLIFFGLPRNNESYCFSTPSNPVPVLPTTPKIELKISSSG